MGEVPLEQVRNAVYKGKVLDDDRSIAQSGLEQGAVIILTLKVTL